ncbi:MAG TPA: hypothetical protein VJT73_07045 [Polyangiaceae bacterium]|nr:hypothetical protein [Polyangiaceae bacterium]
MNRAKQSALGRAGALLLSLVMAGCERQEPAPPEAPPVVASSTAPDRLLPDELAEGTSRIFGLAVPRKMTVERMFSNSGTARGPIGAPALAAYVRRRVDSIGVEIGAVHTVFPKAHVKGEDPKKLVRIEILLSEDGTTLLSLTDITPPQVPEGLSEEERWKRAGVVPGKRAAPKAL